MRLVAVGLAGVVLLMVACGEATTPSAEGAATLPSAPTSDIKAKAVSDDVRIYGAKKQVRLLLRDPSSAEFRSLGVHRAGKITAVCGQVNSANGFGGLTGFQRFVSDGASVTALEESLPRGEMDKLWAALCAN